MHFVNGLIVGCRINRGVKNGSKIFVQETAGLAAKRSGRN